MSEKIKINIIIPEHRYLNNGSTAVHSIINIIYKKCGLYCSLNWIYFVTGMTKIKLSNTISFHVVATLNLNYKITSESL